MSQGLVVGIFPGADPAAIEAALAAQQVDITKVKVIRSSVHATPDDDDSALTFVDVERNIESDNFSDDMTKGMGIMGDAGGTGVPGMGTGGAGIAAFSSHEDAAKAYLTGIAIPSDEIDNFNDAIEEGRAVIAYPDAGDSVTTIAAAFKAAGLRNIRTF